MNEKSVSKVSTSKSSDTDPKKPIVLFKCFIKTQVGRNPENRLEIQVHSDISKVLHNPTRQSYGKKLL
ncbi:hypothetical protein BpHYR1_005747 [Brachionus plicatilis]|uniref:Uncharacterized protein n=1 Tax=Brachionus plicatilis TaxID=10195 RepID=A0A3M7S1T8_BRAPC|nr:hypothetical protein BpHYR1_005747 [Brachionus plicatilis]